MEILLFGLAVIVSAAVIVMIYALATKLISNLLFGSSLTFGGSCRLTLRAMGYTFLATLAGGLVIGLSSYLSEVLGILFSLALAIGLYYLNAKIYGNSIVDENGEPIGAWKGLAVYFLNGIVIVLGLMLIGFILGASVAGLGSVMFM